MTLLEQPCEREVLDQLIDRGRVGRSGIVVLRAESGVGKTALLECVVESASDLRVECGGGVGEGAGVRSAAPAVRADLGPARSLPRPQRDTLAITFGLSEGAVPDRSLVGLAVPGLLPEVAEEPALGCLVDDAQWLHQPSLAEQVAEPAEQWIRDDLCEQDPCY